MREAPDAAHYQVSISAPSLDGCRVVAHMMSHMGMVGDVTSNSSAMRGGNAEHGCRLFLVHTNVADIKRLFDRLKNDHPDLGCAHLRSIHNHYEGCIYNVQHQTTHSHCPHYNRRQRNGDGPAGGIV